MRYNQLVRNAQIQRQAYIADLTAQSILWVLARAKTAVNYIKITFGAVEEGSQRYSRLKNVCSFDH